MTPPPPSSTAPDESGISSEIQNAEASARGKAPAAPAPQEEEEIASGKRVPAMTLHLWESILKPRGFEVQGGRLVRSPSKSQSAASAQAAANAQRRDGSPSRAGPRQLSKRGTMKDLDGDKAQKVPISALSKFQRSRSFLPNSQDASTPKNGIRQPFQRTSTMSRTSSFLQRPPGSIQAMAGMASDIPIVSSSYAAGPSRAGSAVPEEALTNGTGISDAARVIFKGYRFRALGEARCASVKSAIEECGGRWISKGDDADVDFIVVRLVRCAPRCPLVVWLLNTNNVAEAIFSGRRRTRRSAGNTGPSVGWNGVCSRSDYSVRRNISRIHRSRLKCLSLVRRRSC